MKKANSLILMFLASILISVFSSMASNVVIDKTEKTGVKLVSSDSKAMELVFTFNGYSTIEVKTPKGEASILMLEKGSPILETGAPDLQKWTTSVIVSETERMDLEVLNAEFVEYPNIEVAPSKGNLYRDQNPAKVSYTYGAAYQTDAFYPGILAELRKPYILRDYRGQTIVVNPLQYNPATKTLRVYTQIRVRLMNSGELGENPVTFKAPKKSSAEYQQIYQHQFLNYQTPKYTPVEESGNLLIVSPAKYVEAVKPLADWKNKRGLVTEIVEFSASTTGNNAEDLQEYIRLYYQQKGLTFLLLVGDANDIPSLYASGDSDVAYAYMAGNDSYPEFFVGRLSGSTTTHIQNQVEKSIYYERDIDETAIWLSNGMVIASDEGGGGQGDDGESDKQHMEKIKTDLLSFTYEQVATAYDPGATALQVSNAINTGLSNINYVGHGADTYWVTTGFDVADCNNLTNYNKFPFVFDVACVNGNFHGQTCFAEAFVQARKNDQPTGALAIIASTINQSWAPPMDGQDEMVDILIESYENNIKRTFGGIAYNGCLHMNDEYGSDGEDMTDTWTTFGDPSVLVRTKTPVAMEVSHADEILIGTSSLLVSCNAEQGLVGLSHQNTVVATAVVVNGEALLEFEPFTDVANLDLVITGFNLRTYQSVVKVIPAQGPYISMVKASVNDRYGNNNNWLDSGEEVFIDVQIKNVGVETAADVQVVLSTTDEFIQILQASHSFGTINAGSQTGNSGLKIKVSGATPNQHQSVFTLTITDNLEHQWIRTVEFTVNAPVVSLGDAVLIEDGTYGDGNNKLEPGESGFLLLSILNEGTQTSSPLQIRWEASSPYVILDGELVEVDAIEPGQTGYAKVKASTSSHTPQGTKISVNYGRAPEDSLRNTYQFVVGQPPLLELGSGTTKKYQYPFYNYYKSNKTQMLFLADEFSSGTQLINELALNLASVTTNEKHRMLKNFVIVMGTTPATQMDTSYATIENPDTVLYQDSLELSAVTGWFGLAIDPFEYQTKQGNLLVEIYWGVNESYCASTDRTSVYCSETPAPTVAYGYADNEYPAQFDGSNNIRPNVKFGFIDQNLKQDTLTLVVVDELLVPVSESQVTLGSQQWLTNTDGKITGYLAHGTYETFVSKKGFQPLQQAVELNDTVKTDTLILQNYENLYEVAIQITDDTNALEGATVTFNSQSQTTTASGELQFSEIPEGTYILLVEAPGFEFLEQEVTITNDTLVTINLTKMPIYTVTFEFTEKEVPLAGVNVLFNNDWVISETDGKATFEGIASGATLIYYIEKWGYYSSSDTLDSIAGDLNLTIQMQKIPDLLIHVTNKFGKMEKAKVTFQNQTVYSNLNGEALFEDVKLGEDQLVSLECPGYYGITDTIDISNTDKAHEGYLFKKTDVSLQVTDGQNPMPGINVVMGAKEKVTDEQGAVVFKSNEEASQVAMSINQTGYYPVNRTFDFVKDVDIEETIVLEFIPDVEFTLLFKGTPVAGITLNFNGVNWVSDESGKILLTDVAKGDYTYSVEETGYYAVQESLTIALSNVVLPIELKMIPDVSFTITHNGEAETEVSVLLGTQEQTTSALGKTSFVDIPAGTHSYAISKEGFNSINGELIVGEEDVQVDVNIYLVSVASNSAVTCQIYPNPSKGRVILEYSGKVPVVELDIYDEIGQKVITVNKVSTRNEIDITSLPKGMYLIILQTAQETIPIRHIIE